MPGPDIFTPPPPAKTSLGKRRVLSPLAGIRVSPLQIGAMSFGESWSDFMGTAPYEATAKLLDAFVDAGGNFIDTANNYQNEESEQFIGRWMTERGNRDQMVIATKYTSGYRSYEDGKQLSTNTSGNHKKSLHLSLKHLGVLIVELGTDYIDILYLHWWEYTTSIEEVMDSLDILVKSGKVLYLGISDTPAWVVSAANTYAKAHGKAQFVIYQGRWNVMLRDLENDILPMARHFGLAIAPWDVMGGGRLKTKAQLEELKKDGRGVRAGHNPERMTEQEINASEVLGKVAEEHKVGIQAIAIAYIQSKAPYIFPIIGGRKVEHLMDNIKAIDVILTPEQIKAIEGIKEFAPIFPHSMIGPDPKVTGGPGGLLGCTANFDWPTPEKAVGY